ncbi:MAG TPA: hypothetical protein PLR71_02855 [Deltaproteobacteria bacterium]|nr:hypothetical protein [Deltaproteobacteria bacterium]HQI80476.1 hypothetical protein [Deltaproteobacteria bacterium]
MTAAFLLGVIVLLPLCPPCAFTAHARELETLNTAEAAFFSEPGLKMEARELASLYPVVRAELEATLGLRVDFRPSVILVSDREAFEQVTQSRMIVAYAVPERMLMVIDYPRSSTGPFTARAILKHELCHLLLHRHIGPMPRWLDEGVCQWASDGYGELFSEHRGTSLQWASISGGLLPLSGMERSFPQDERGLVLAYEQSRSIIDFIAARYGANGITNLLMALKQERSVQGATILSLGIPVQVLERDWRQSLGTWKALLVFLAANIYSILFFLAALLTLAGYARYRIRKKRLSDGEGEAPADS